MKGSESLVKTFARVAVVLNCCLSTTSEIFLQNLVSASSAAVYSQEDIYNARLVFTSDIYPKINKQLSQKHFPTSFGTETTRNNEIRYYLYFDNNGNIKIRISPEQWNALNVIKNAFGLRDVMDVVNNANIYIVSPEFNAPRVTSTPASYPTQPHIITQAPHMQQYVPQSPNFMNSSSFAQQSSSTPEYGIRFDHYSASQKSIIDVLGFPPSSLSDVKNFDDLLNHIKNKADELIRNKSKLDSKNLARYRKCLKAINGRVYKLLGSSLPNFDYYVFAWGKILEPLEYEWDSIYKAYRELEKEHKNNNICICYKKSNSCTVISDISYDRKDSGLGVGKIMNYGYPPVRELTEVFLSFFNI